MRINTLYLALLLLTVPPTVFAQDYFAGQITPATLERLPEGGLSAVGGLGDWLLSNGRLCAVVSGAGHPSYFSLDGGALVDLWHCERANDQWNVAHTQLNLQKEELPPTTNIVAGHDATNAWLETHGTRDGLETVVRYALNGADSEQLEITTTITRIGSGKALKMLGAMVLHPRGSLRPFSIDTSNPEKSHGFNHPDIDTTDRAAILASVNTTDLQILLGSPHIEPNISYGIKVDGAEFRNAEGDSKALNTFMIGGRDFTMFGAFSKPFPRFWPREPGIVSFALGQLFDLGAQEQFIFRQTIHVAERADTAIFTDAVYEGSTITGVLDTHRAGISVADAQGNPLTYIRPQEDGRFSFRLPKHISDFKLVVETPWSNSAILGASTNPDLGKLVTGTPGQMTLPKGSPMSLLFSTTGDRHVFHDALTPLRIGGERLRSGPEAYRLNLSGTDADPATVDLPPGHYEVIASRGPEYSVTRNAVVIKAGEVTTLTIPAPSRQVQTPGLIGVDFHVHSGVSFDSSLAPRQRVIDFVAQGGEVLVPTEHNITFDIRPTIEHLGLANLLHSFPGVEITGMARSSAAPTTIGHSNVFPVDVEETAFMGGTLPFEGKRLGHVIEAYKKRFPNSVFQLNHPRSVAFDDDISFFNHLSLGKPYKPEQPLTHPANKSLIEALPGSQYRDIDFDTLELLNGESVDIYELVRKDWFALLQQNLFKVATANSDSHVSMQMVAYPRSYVEVSNDDPGSVETSEIISALKRGAVYGSTGPIIRVAINKAGPGETLVATGGTLSIEAATSHWIDADEAHVWVNGELTATLPLDHNGHAQMEIEISRDSFVFVEVWGDASELYRKILPGFKPFAFANPIFMDVAGNGWSYGED